ncbi:sucrose-specific PTS transporter subunit IIBC [Anaerococcus sp. NML200537]|uniref:sucrose-specific PTS transporter subunit IIBC n=1 Tax=Anaerococcus sp. NML200537 TaxID=2954485 RepID=UPI002238ED96|nr:sucrose-specific PTS transporter subunit IIBC [Anaerococcus sp. NML200537]MCW6701361.1 sucrose-specific PTS transporter subunit IIBC [Anaerococcus sp. NML200537]
MNNQELAKIIVDKVGGKDNIISYQHCATRLRLVLKDFDKIDRDFIDDLEGVQGTNIANGQYQIILGPGKVNLVTGEVGKIVGESGASEPSDAPKGNILQRGVKVLSDIFVPIIPAIVAAGLLMGINNILTSPFFNGRTDSIISLYPQIADLANMINVFSSAAFAFLPVLIGFSATKKFGGNPFLGAAMGMIMVHPELLNAYVLGTTAPADVPVWNILGLAIPAVGYQGTVLPVLAVSWILAKIENFLHDKTPIWLDNLTTPLLATLITGFITFILVGPIMRNAGDMLTNAITFIYTKLGFVGGAIFGLLYAPITLTGMHHSFIPIETQLIANQAVSGGSFIFPTASMNNVAQGAAVIAVLLTTKNEKMKSTAAASGVSAMLGITEPAMFGITLRLRYPFIAAIIGSAAGSAYIALRHVLAIALGAAGIPGIISIRPENWLDFIIGLLIAMVVAFGLTIFFGKSNMFAAKEKPDPKAKDQPKVPEKPAEKPAEKEEIKAATPKKEIIEIFNPVKGEVFNVSQSVDQTFASKMMGDGVCINPSEGRVYAPFDGEVASIFPTGHAVTLSSEDGINVLIHVGVDTVSLDGAGFTKHVKDGDKVKTGDLLIEFDPDLIKSKGLSDQTMVIIMDSDGMDIKFKQGLRDKSAKIMEIKNA